MITIERLSETTEPVRAQLSAMLLDYHRRTELEKSLGRQPEPEEQSDAVDLPARHRKEIDHPDEAFAGATVLIAVDDSSALGCVVLTAGPSPEVKRLWVTLAARRRGVATQLLDAAASAAAARGDRELRLSVWYWRAAAIALYERAGFVSVPSWDERPGLSCFAHPLG
ncbi:MAG TPA: GNAT family N-acetyltransferase [Plantibacter sp.]|uniref:GNAT family N-acetyltransferase n=1 Tax=unclassified Plantibacter TaxID=2624265 RepID=UPI002B7A575C|nr:GNAT family N-acetyltransferase [Plantibacter sp.]